MVRHRDAMVVAMTPRERFDLVLVLIALAAAPAVACAVPIVRMIGDLIR